MLFAILTLLVALSISAIAAYYSIVGLAAIFAAAVVPIILMGAVLEVGKIVSTVWLHTFWKKAPKLTKAYLSSAVLILMFITSMGIFGFLSKSHIQQTAKSQDQVAQISTIDGNIGRANAKITRWTDEIDRISQGTNSRVDILVDKEQEILEQLYSRIDKEKSQARTQSDKNIQLQNDRIAQARQRKDDNIKNIEIKYNNGLNNSAKSKEIDQEKKNEVGVAASAQRNIRAIQKTLEATLLSVDSKYTKQITTITGRIDKLRNQSNVKTDDIDGRVEELEGFVTNEQKKVDGFRSAKSKIETSVRQLEAEVGPIKYIAEFIYGEDADRNLLEAAVRWVIIIIVAVFDPLAIMLVLAATMQIRWIREEKHGPEAKELRIKELEMKIEEYNEFLIKLESELDRLTQEGEEKSERITELESAIEEVNNDKVKAVSELEKLVEKDKNKYSTIIDGLTDDLTESKITGKEQSKTIKELKAQIKDLENKEPEIREVEVEVEKLVEDETKIREANAATKLKDQEAKELANQVRARDAAMERLNEKYKLVEKPMLEQLAPVADDEEDDNEIPPAAFGSVYPDSPKNGQLFTKTDVFPHSLYKFNGKKWIDVDKNGTDSYLTEEYVRHLVEAVAKGETELEDLTDQEKTEMTDFLSKG
jgi:myosin heavy subunit